MIVHMNNDVIDCIKSKFLEKSLGCTRAVVGGHLAPGTTVFAAEYVIQAFDGPEFCRGFDEMTGLPL